MYHLTQNVFIIANINNCWVTLHLDVNWGETPVHVKSCAK